MVAVDVCVVFAFALILLWVSSLLPFLILLLFSLIVVSVALVGAAVVAVLVITVAYAARVLLFYSCSYYSPNSACA